ncbi:MAG: tRNA (N6-isopentenyl adenosine(37)-C2)-methylthiotransferase MiaB [bacterium]|nr:tRNA (N6-isopentenyl adenosine(37)-C2)-methylthiotransferase MiaB [bacterium]
MYNEIDLDKIDITTSPPAEEPARQYFFMAKCREWVRQFERENGRRPTFFIQTFGCQMNARDSEKLAGILKGAGYEAAENEKADFVAFNTCTVRDNANQRVYGRLGELNGYKKRNPKMKVALCGCMMQEPAVIEKIKKSYGFVNLLFGTHNLFKFAELLYTANVTDGTVIDIWEDTDRIVEELPSERKYPYKSGVNIMYGCNNFCSYCIVPYVRGRERSREPEEILKEIRALVADGVSEVMLLGQNVNSYGKNLREPVTFAELLREAEKIEGLKRIRFMTSHPKDLSDELIRVMKESGKVCRHLHLPLQSGSTRILERMNRRYTKEQYLELALKIRREIPDIAITTDIIVGFPGETPEDLEETIDVVRRVRFENAFTFLYSKRTGTPAAAMEDPIPPGQVKAGFDRLLKVVQETAREQAAGHQGKVMEALIEEVNESDPSMVTGRLSNNMLVHLPGDASLIGEIVPVALEECHGFYYIGRVAEDSL